MSVKWYYCKSCATRLPMYLEEDFSKKMKINLRISKESMKTKYHEREWKVRDIEKMLDIDMKTPKIKFNLSI